ncbi:MAG: hypothetical protein GX542_11110 [Rhodococcus sp.]|nr:hypothetical protein [Rhodococcus sp. (in: high G+C Gram-positive bacteria)]
MKIRKFARGLAAASLAAGIAIGATGTASAAPEPAPGLRWGLFNTNASNIWVLGNNSWCNGHIDFTVETDVERPGVVIVTSTPRAAQSPSPAWKENPTCDADVVLLWGNGWNNSGTEFVPITLTDRPGEPIRTELHTGSGQHATLTIAAPPAYGHTKLRNVFSYETGAYFAVP